MDMSQLATGQGSSIPGTGGHHHHHHKSISDQVSQMGSVIDPAVSAGTMTSDQATTLKKELADVTQTLNQNAQTSSTAASGSSAGTSSQTNPLSQLSDSDRKKVFSELQDVRKQLHAALGSQNATAASGSSGGNSAASNLFARIDSNGDGSISQSEFTQFLAQVGANALGYNQQGSTSADSEASAGNGFSVTV